MEIQQKVTPEELEDLWNAKEDDIEVTQRELRIAELQYKRAINRFNLEQDRGDGSAKVIYDKVKNLDPEILRDLTKNLEGHYERGNL